MAAIAGAGVETGEHGASVGGFQNAFLACAVVSLVAAVVLPLADIDSIGPINTLRRIEG